MQTRVYACYNKSEPVRMISSSGGMFYLLAKTVVNAGGVVFGARFNKDWNVEHGYCETLEEIQSFMQSKYVQSYIGDTYEKTKLFLERGRVVLYSGTPCQINGLKLFLGKEYENLLAVDFICHGVPSPLVWRKYLLEISEDREIQDINFRDKTEGWIDYSLRIDFKDGSTYRKNLKEDIYMKGFLQDLYLRPSCYECHFRGLQRESDVTLADFWGVQELLPDMFDDKGTSIILVHTEKGMKILEIILAEMEICEISSEIVRKTNSAVEKSCEINPRRKRFYATIDRGVIKAIKKQTRVSVWLRLRRKIKTLLKRMIKR